MDRKLILSIDTEEDSWGWRSEGPYRCRNALQLPRLARFCEERGLRPTFFVSHQALLDPEAQAVLRELAAEEWIELGSHVHPWNTPPLDSTPRDTMLFNYGYEQQKSKIRALTDLFDEALGFRPISFRAGGFGFGNDTAAALLENGYEVDSSVTPFWDWSTSSDGQNYFGAALDTYRIDPGQGVLRHTPNGPLIEVPLTAGYDRAPTNMWYRVHRSLENRVAKATHLGGVVTFLGGPRRVILGPEAHAVADMVSLGRRVLQAGIGHLHLFFHSSSLEPGLTPFASSAKEVDRLYDRMDEFLDGVGTEYELRPRTVQEVAASDAGPSDGVQDSPSRTTSSAEWRPTPRSKVMASTEHHGSTALMLEYLAKYGAWMLGGYRRYRRVDWSRVSRLVFVCRGNICRSAYAEHWCRRIGVAAASMGVDTKPGGPANADAARLSVQRRVSLDLHLTTPARDFTAQDGDLFLAMEPYQAAVIQGMNWGVDTQTSLLGLWAEANGPVISDPFGRSDETFLDCFSQIERAVDRIRRELRLHGGQALSSFAGSRAE